MTRVNYTPRTRKVPVSSLRAGHIVMESPEHPAQITRLARPFGRDAAVTIWCRFVWQASREPEWVLGVFSSESILEKAVR